MANWLLVSTWPQAPSACHNNVPLRSASWGPQSVTWSCSLGWRLCLMGYQGPQSAQTNAAEPLGPKTAPQGREWKGKMSWKQQSGTQPGHTGSTPRAAQGMAKVCPCQGQKGSPRQSRRSWCPHQLPTQTPRAGASGALEHRRAPVQDGTCPPQAACPQQPPRTDFFLWTCCTTEKCVTVHGGRRAPHTTSLQEQRAEVVLT